MTEEELKRVEKQREHLGELLDDLQSGKIYVADLDEARVAQLREI